tara:strand:+ start:118 stop:306 length:189 start_codon:yes stop_codon:yes gene_type:complete
MALYKLLNSPATKSVTSVLKNPSGPDTVSIPLDPDNTYYQEYLAWVADGNTADPADPIKEDE